MTVASDGESALPVNGTRHRPLRSRPAHRRGRHGRGLCRAGTLNSGATFALKIVIGHRPRARRRDCAARRSTRLQPNHPHICTIHEVGAFDGQPYIIMEYVEGERLSDDSFRETASTSKDLLRFGVQIADGLAHAHLHGVTHRDLKSDNVVITPDGRAKILDFGLAERLAPQHLQELSESRATFPAGAADKVVAGTLSSMAPELLRGQQADERSDIWALGVLLYQMAAGTRPFSGATGFELSGAILCTSHRRRCRIVSLQHFRPSFAVVWQRNRANDINTPTKFDRRLETVHSGAAEAAPAGRRDRGRRSSVC